MDNNPTIQSLTVALQNIQEQCVTVIEKCGKLLKKNKKISRRIRELEDEKLAYQAEIKKYKDSKKALKKKLSKKEKELITKEIGIQVQLNDTNCASSQHRSEIINNLVVKGGSELEKINRFTLQAQQWMSQQQMPFWPQRTSTTMTTTSSAANFSFCRPQGTWNTPAWQGQRSQNSQQKNCGQNWAQNQQTNVPIVSTVKPIEPAQNIDCIMKEIDKLGDLSMEEEEFNKQFKYCEEQFEIWRKQSQNHPDKKAFEGYKKQWKEWRDDLLKRKEEKQKERAKRIEVGDDVTKGKDTAPIQSTTSTTAMTAKPPSTLPVLPSTNIPPTCLIDELPSTMAGMPPCHSSPNIQQPPHDNQFNTQRMPSLFDSQKPSPSFQQQHPLNEQPQSAMETFIHCINERSMTAQGSQSIATVLQNKSPDEISDALVLSIDQVHNIFGPMCKSLLELESELNVTIKVQSMDIPDRYTATIIGQRILVDKAKQFILEKAKMDFHGSNLINSSKTSFINKDQFPVLNEATNVNSATARCNSNRQFVKKNNTPLKQKFVKQKFSASHKRVQEVFQVFKGPISRIQNQSRANVTCHPSSKPDLCFIHIKGTIEEFRTAHSILYNESIKGLLKIRPVGEMTQCNSKK